jgi:hypothetical protein
MDVRESGHLWAEIHRKQDCLNLLQVIFIVPKAAMSKGLNHEIKNKIYFNLTDRLVGRDIFH